MALFPRVQDRGTYELHIEKQKQAEKDADLYQLKHLNRYA